jgi:hypothetical protein
MYLRYVASVVQDGLRAPLAGNHDLVQFRERLGWFRLRPRREIYLEQATSQYRTSIMSCMFSIHTVTRAGQPGSCCR